MEENKKILLLFDVDGTLTPTRKVIEKDMLITLEKIYNNKNIDMGTVGGSHFDLQKEQITQKGLSYFKYWFSENGLIAYKNNEKIFEGSLSKCFEEKALQEFINECLKYIVNLDIPIKRGTFVQFRRGMINVSPIGRDCSYEEREEFYKYDEKHQIRKKMIKHLKEKFGNMNLKFSIGGQISFDVFPEGWDKTYCLKHINKEEYSKIYFFGDKVEKGGNDYEIYSSKQVIGNYVKNPQETIKILTKLFL